VTYRKQSSKVAIMFLLVLPVVVLVFMTTYLTTAAAQFSAPIVTATSIPFSGTLTTPFEQIAISGTVQIQTHVTLTKTTVFAEVNSTISQTAGTGATSAQKFVGVPVPLQMCKIPAGLRNSSAIGLDLTAQFRLIPVGPLSPFYPRGIPETQLPLIVQVKFRGDGTLAGATALLAASATGSDSSQTQ
jgi:hypothetical protein